MELLERALASTALVVAIDPGKVSNRVWLASGEHGLLAEPVSLPVLGEGIETLSRMITASGIPGPPVIGIEATGGLHHAWTTELERRYPGSVRLFAPSQTHAARAQLGWRRHKTDDRDCAALVWLLRQGTGHRVAQTGSDALLAAVRHRRALVADRKTLQQRLHSLPPARDWPPCTAHTKACRLTAPISPPARPPGTTHAARRPAGRHDRPTPACPPSPLTRRAKASAPTGRSPRLDLTLPGSRPGRPPLNERPGRPLRPRRRRAGRPSSPAPA